MIESSELKTAVLAAQSGGQIVADFFRSGYSRNTEAQQKIRGCEPQGLVTAADIQAEEKIVSVIRERYPDHAMLAEESYHETGEAAHLWVIDPLDGTNNFAHGIPHFAVSVAYYRNGQPHCGVVYQPISDETFTTVSGHGAWHDGQRVSVNEHSALDQAMVAVGFYYDRGQMMRDTLAAIERLFGANVQGVRRMGTASLDLVQVGLGRFGAFFEYTLSPWDFAAGRLFVEQAGGRVTDCSGQPLALTKTSVLATNGLLHESMLDKVNNAIQHLPDKTVS